MNFSVNDWRARSMLNKGIPTDPMRFSISNYHTDASINNKMSVNHKEELIYNSFRSISEPMIQNLANSVITVDEKNKLNTQMSVTSQNIFYNSGMEKESMNTSVKDPSKTQTIPEGDSLGSLTGIAGFFSNVIGAISSAMFHRRPKSPVSQYYDCFDGTDEHTGWHPANNQDQNKNGWAHEQCAANDNMNNCKTVAAHCEGKLNVVKNLLVSKTVPSTPKFRPRRPKKLFIEPGSVEDSFEDAFTPDDFVSVASEEFIEYYSVCNNHHDSMSETQTEIKTETVPATKPMEITKTDIIKNESTISTPENNIEDISKAKNLVNNVPEVDIAPLTNDTAVNENNLDKVTKMPEVLEKPVISQPNPSDSDLKQIIIASVEEKMAKLKLLLKDKRKPTRNTETVPSSDTDLLHQSKDTLQNSPPITIKEPSSMDSIAEESIVTNTETEKGIPIAKTHNKHHKNLHRTTEKHIKCKQRKDIQDATLFGHEIDSDHLSSSNSPICSSLDRLSDSKSDVSDSADEYFDEIKGRFHKTSTTDSEDSFQIVFADTPKRTRKASDCESEDSFIIFEETPDCYTNNEVFGESDSEDSESELSDSGVEVCKLGHSFSKTVGDLTDTSLYNDKEVDELDCAVRSVCEEIPSESINDVSECAESSGLLIDAAKKLKRKDLPPKKVTFSEKPPKVHVMRVWAFAARQARAGHWERHALDRERFKRRIADVDVAISWVLKPQHRRRVMFQRFMPFWHAQRRRELAEKKQREEEERLKKIQEEEDRLRKIELGIFEEENTTDNTNTEIDNVDDKDNKESIDNSVAIQNNIDKESSVAIQNNVDKEKDIAIQNNVATQNTGIKVAKENLNGKFIGVLKGKKEDLKSVRKNLIHKAPQNRKKVLTK